MKRILYLVFTLQILFLSNGCFICEEGSGPYKTEPRKHHEFRSIEVCLDAEVTIRSGKDYSVMVSAEESLLEKIRSRVRGKKLVIESKRCLRANKDIQIEIVVPELEEIALSGSGNVYIRDTMHFRNLLLKVNGSGDMDVKLTAASLTSAINGSGSLILQGSANLHDIKINGSGNVDAREMPCNRSTVKVNGSGDVKAYVIEQMDVQVNGSGSVYFKGKPKLSTRINGSGKVVDEN
jgi:hypothetical protein